MSDSDAEPKVEATWPPDRKVKYAAYAGVIVWLVGVGLEKGFGIPIPLEIGLALNTIVMSIIGYIVPWAEKEVKRRMTTRMVLEAQLDPRSPVDLPMTKATALTALAEEKAKEA